MSYYVSLFNQSFNPIPHTLLRLKPRRYSSAAVGGYEQAQISIETDSPLLLWEALRWLRYYVLIRNEYRNIVWAGLVTASEVNFGGIQLGKALDDMANRILVVYSSSDANGTVAQGRSTWGDNLESQARYGIKELIQSEGDTDATQAAALRDDALGKIGEPVNTPALIGQGNIGGTLTCKGLWFTSAWRIYNQPGGVVRYTDTGNFEHILGWGFSSNQIAFYANTDGISDFGRRLKDLRKDDQVVVSGATNSANNGTFTIDQTAQVNEPHTITSAAISFNAVDDIQRTAGGFGFIQANELLLVSGSSVAGNNRYYFAKPNLADDHITVTPNTVANSAAGASVTITQGHSVSTTAALITEYPANTITLRAIGEVMAQSWTLDINLSWPVAEVYVRVKRVGNPTDSFWAGIQADSGGSPTNTNIDGTLVLGSTLSTDMSWLKIDFASTFTPVYGTTYWLAVGRTGANSPTDYYVVDLNENAGFGLGTLKLWDGSAWVARSWGADSKTADMPFQIWGHRETTAQINDMLIYANQFFSSVDIQAASGVFSRLYRDADQTSQTEIENLMKAGTTANKRLLASVTPDRAVHVFEEPNYDSSIAPLLDVYGKEYNLLTSSGQPYEPGRLPTGQWVTLAGVPSNVDEFVGMSSQLVERAEWDAEAEKFSAIEFKGAPNPWDVVHLR